MSNATFLTLPRKRAQQLTSFDAKYLSTAPRAQRAKQRTYYAAPVLDSSRNARANGSNRSYSYMTSAETWAARWGK